MAEILILLCNESFLNDYYFLCLPGFSTKSSMFGWFDKREPRRVTVDEHPNIDALIHKEGYA